MRGLRQNSGIVLLLALCCIAPAQENETTAPSSEVCIPTDAPRFCYRYQEVPYKPYVKSLLTPSGREVLLDAPPDHLHHHGIMLAYAVDGIDFWQEAVTAGRQVHLSCIALPAIRRISLGGVVHDIAWTTPESHEVLLQEKRTIVLLNNKKHKCTLLSWESEFTLPKGKESVTLTGSHYFGLGMRFSVEMNEIGYFLHPEDDAGELVRGDEKLYSAPWCAYQIAEGTHPVTVAGFSHPTNVRFPTRWFTMAKPFAYLSATLNVWKEPLKIDGPVRLRYGIAAWDSAPDKKTIDQVYRYWVKMVDKFQKDTGNSLDNRNAVR